MHESARKLLLAVSAPFVPTAPADLPGRIEKRLFVMLIIASAILRFWGLGDAGLHPPDEDTVALPATHLAWHGEPRFPSGMYYSRAIIQTQLVAWSVLAFGNTEWALRLPSALCGVLVTVLAFFAGRRFLQPAWNLGFVAAVAFLPELVFQSQTARMYIFLVACIAAFLICMFAWERSGRIRHLAGALAMMLLGLQFQALMIFTSLLLLYPGLLRADITRIAQGVMGILISFLGFSLISSWNGSQYFTGDVAELSRLLGLPVDALQAVETWRPHWHWSSGLAMLVVPALCAWLVVRSVEHRTGRIAAAILIGLGLCAQLMFSYHVSLVLLMAGCVVAGRSHLGRPASLGILAATFLAIAVVHVSWLMTLDLGGRGPVVAAMMGTASVWSFLLYAPVSYGATAIATAGAVIALWRIATVRPVPDVWLFALLGVWAPMFLIGTRDSYPEYRYMTGALLPLLIVAFASCQWFGELLSRRTSRLIPPPARVFVVVIAVALIVNPVKVVGVAMPGDEHYPDHKGAAAYLRSLQLPPTVILVAEDAIMQSYYLGRVDYLLTNAETALQFSYVADGEVREIYSNARVIATPDQLEALINDKRRPDLYIIGSGEHFTDGHRWQRGKAIEKILAKLDVVYRGRDGLTKVWKSPSAGGQ
jgi:4-amino-4-deoxy-L-arabinose transferase-like glycosyltransferase